MRGRGNLKGRARFPQAGRELRVLIALPVTRLHRRECLCQFEGPKDEA
jgi:hypothetical protein